MPRMLLSEAIVRKAPGFQLQHGCSNTSSNALNNHTSSTHKASQTTATTTAMSQLPTEDIAAMPSQKLVFNAPFDHKITCYMRVINPGTKRIGYAFKTTKPKRINVSPTTGVLGPKEFVNVAIFCGAFDPGSEDTKGDRVTVQSTNAPDPPPATAAQEWTNTPDPAATVFKLDWFQGDELGRRLMGLAPAFLRAIATSSANYIIRLVGFEPTLIEPLEWMNETSEKLTLTKASEDKWGNRWILKRCQIGETAEIQWENENWDDFNYVHFTLYYWDVGPLSPPKAGQMNAKSGN
ncbi:hypothetical protein niasHS_007816 [Heterodera schachtii]|uniref:Major sperm protein n=1 Tax=Heterodera schachtii TaxID=97005 RepID=A0ABD2JPR2_HETSC